MEITDQTFDDILSKESTLLVGFGAPWCGNCRNFLPVLEETAKKVGLPMYSLVVDDNPQSVQNYEVHPVPVRYDVRGVPTVIVFRDGREAGRVVGALPEDKLQEKIKEIVA